MSIKSVSKDKESNTKNIQAYAGAFKDDDKARNEFLNLIR